MDYCEKSVESDKVSTFSRSKRYVCITKQSMSFGFEPIRSSAVSCNYCIIGQGKRMEEGAIKIPSRIS